MLPPSSDVALYGEVTGESCGYCHAGHSCNYGVSAVRMLPEDYEALMLRGFRRSGDYLYKPVMYKVRSFTD
jgi:arginyl-tRNA--protein-N-Asp/Glu arginylyltransferase